MTEQEALIVLNAVPGLGNIRIRKFLEYYGSASAVCALKKKDFIASQSIPPKTVEKIFHFDRDKFLRNEYNLLNKHRIQIITCGDDCYPANLGEIPDAPVVLYMKGSVPRDSGLAIAMVGSRRASYYGLSVAEKFAGRLAELGITIVSGLARGIDAAAHRGCLKAKGRTFAVLGCGLSQVYPPENKDLFDAIIEEGAVISEFPMETPPVSYNFPRRNRIVSGLSLGVVVVEAASRSGALITSRFALEQGREVFAVPGKVDQPNSQGVNQLIQDGAKLISCIEDIVAELKPRIQQLLAEDQTKESNKATVLPGRTLSEQEQKIMGHIQDEPISLDELAVKFKGSMASIMNVLLHLELKQVIKQLPGKLFIRK